MKVEIIVDPSRAAGAAGSSLAGRLAPVAAPTGPAAAKAAGSATVAAAGGSAVQNPRRQGGGRRGGRGGRGGRRGEDRPKATVESLDAEMSDWQAQVSAAGTNGGEAAAPAAAAEGSA
ncbi:hypothetical protein JCM6882_006926 [Rhodosporidiobolus microsporus]